MRSRTRYVRGFFDMRLANNWYSRHCANFVSIFSRRSLLACKQAEAASVLFNANSGQHMVESKQPLSPLDVTVEAPTRILHLTGTTLSMSQQFASLREMQETIEGIYFVFPSLVNIPFADPPYIERVDGKVGPTTFRWELDGWRMEFRTTTQENQEERFAKAWERMGVLSEPHRRRLVAGLHYFHVACRLARVGPRQVSSCLKLS